MRTTLTSWRVLLGLALIITAVVVALGTAAADATRPIPGYRYKDVCKNVPGHQSILDTVGITARWQFVVETPRPWDCERSWRSQVVKG